MERKEGAKVSKDSLQDARGSYCLQFTSNVEEMFQDMLIDAAVMDPCWHKTIPC